MPSHDISRQRHHVTLRLIPLIKRMIYSPWRSKVLFIYCEDLAQPNSKKCLVNVNHQIDRHSELFQVICDDFHLPFEDNFFDAVIIDLSLIARCHHKEVLFHAHRVLSLSGKGLICNKNTLSLGQMRQLFKGGQERNYYSFKKLLHQSCFEVLSEHPLSYALSMNNTFWNRKLIRHEKALRKYAPLLANYHCLQVIKNKDNYQPLPDYLRLSKTLPLSGY